MTATSLWISKVHNSHRLQAAHDRRVEAESIPGCVCEISVKTFAIVLLEALKSVGLHMCTDLQMGIWGNWHPCHAMARVAIALGLRQKERLTCNLHQLCVLSDVESS